MRGYLKGQGKGYPRVRGEVITGVSGEGLTQKLTLEILAKKGPGPIT